MIKVNVTRENVITNSALFDTMEEATTWSNNEISMGSFGDLFDVDYIDCTDEMNQQKINKEAKEYLLKTDYVVLKFAEALAKSESIEGLKTQYESILENRAIARGKIV